MFDWVLSSLQTWLNSIPLPAFVVMTAVLGLLIGSFLNVVIYRLPRMLEREERLFVWHSTHDDTQALPEDLKGSYSLLRPASHCPTCQAPVRWWMNIPLLSYVLLKGRCRGCKTGISLQYPVVECLAGLAAVCAALAFGVTVKACAVMVLLWVLLTLTVIDLNTYLLPDALTLPLLWLGLLFNLSGVFVPISSALWGAVLGYLSLWSVYQLFKLLTGKEGMGYGDFKLLAMLGAWLGAGMLLPIILFASVSGAFVGIALIVSKRLQADKAIPFGPYLAAGGVLAIFYGERVVTWYLGLIKL